MNYDIAYRVGFHPWENAIGDPAFVSTFSALLDNEYPGGGPSEGPALDLGCGSGVWTVELARRGWQVTGVDNVETALRRAHTRAREDSVEARLVHGDVTDLRAAGVGSGFTLLLDTGTFHGLSPERRAAMSRELDAVAAPAATLLMLAWTPRRRGPLPRGVSLGEIEEAFRGWVVADAGPSNFHAPGPIQLLFRPDERWYRLSRSPAASENSRAPDDLRARP
ncbi:MAG: class I SAM-dependent methyltransferase [Gaiellaceae bacterium]